MMEPTKVPFSVTLAVLQVILAIKVSYALTTNTTYIVALLGQRIQNETFDSTIGYKFVMTNFGNSSITVTITGVEGELYSETIQANGEKEWNCTETKALNGSEYSNKTLIVQSVDDFTLQVFVVRGNYNEGLLGIPIEKMNRSGTPFQAYEYSVATFCDTSGFCQLSVAAYEDETDISITLPNNVENIVFCKGKFSFNTTARNSIQLMKYDSIQIETTYDLTGTHIYSFKPISVYSGSRSVKKPISVYSGSRSVKTEAIIAHTIEQLVPTWHWGTEYLVKTLPSTNAYGDILIITGSHTNVKIKMSGFHPFTLVDNYRSVSKRLDKGMISHIKASSPIQIMQVSGLKYPSNNDSEESALSMTVVPSVQNIKLYDNNRWFTQTDLLHVQILTEPDSNDKKERYSKYAIEDKSISDLNNLNSRPTILTYKFATMPAAVLYNETINGTDELKPAEISGGICHDGGRVTVPFDAKGTKATPHKIILTDYPDHILKLRARFCGESVVQFFTEAGTLKDSLLVRLSYTQITVTKCESETECMTETFEDASTFNEDLDCSVDMAFFWFHHESARICMGFGHHVNETTRYQNCITASNKFSSVYVMGLFTEASFNWDFEHPNGCGLYEEKWRCFDRLSNCSKYGSSFCSDNNHDGFANHYCSKYCGKCYSDSYGRKYLLASPMEFNKCKIIVSMVNKNTGVAVMDTTKVVRVAGMDNYARYYDCQPKKIYKIITDDEVTVSVLFEVSSRLITFPVYPVDAFGYEYMVLGYDKVKNIPAKCCQHVSEYSDVQQLTFSEASTGPPPYVSSVTAPMQGVEFITPEGNQYSGTKFTFDKPTGVFCGSFYVQAYGTISDDSNHLLPLNTWSTEYYVPAMDPLHSNNMLDANLLIITNSDNTIVNISEGFDGTYPIYNQGDMIQLEIDVSSPYRISSSENINVAIVLHNTNKSVVSFHLIPPVSDMHSVNVQSLPNKIISELFDFTTTDIKTYFIHSNHTSEYKDLNLDDNVYRIVSTNEPKFGVSVVTADDGNWFAMSAPRKVTAKINTQEPCKISSDAVGDNIDGDCDKLTDEEDCFIQAYGVYRQDTDLDGGFGEDCGSTPTPRVPIVKKPVSPVCVIIDRPDNQCWTTCQCKCSWVEKYEATKNLTMEELEEAIASETTKITEELQVNTDSLSSTAAQKQSKGDKRQSAASIGYVGIAMFCIVFGAIFIMDIGSLIRDARILMANLKEGYDRVFGC